MFQDIFNFSNKSTIKSTSITCSKSVVIKNDKIWIDGKEIDTTDKVINVNITGNVEKIDIDYCNQLSVTGNCNSVSTVSGNVKVEGDIVKNVETTSGDIRAREIGGNVKTVSGDVVASKINGSVNTVSGDIEK